MNIYTNIYIYTGNLILCLVIVYKWDTFVEANIYATKGILDKEFTLLF